MSACTCGGRFEGRTGHAPSCPQYEVALKRIRTMEAQEQLERGYAERGRWIAGTFVHVDDLPVKADL